jgi:hypothetical protein
MKMEESCEVQSNRTGDEETEIKLEPDDTYTFAYSVIFKEDYGEVKEEITEEEGGIYQPTNEEEDLRVVEMKAEEEEDNIFQVITQVLKLIFFKPYI